MSEIISLLFCRLFKTNSESSFGQQHGLSIDNDGKYMHSSVICLLCINIIKNFKKGLVCKETTAARLSEKWNGSIDVWCKFNGERDINLCPLCRRRSEISKTGRRRRGQRKVCHATGHSTKEATGDSDTTAPHSTPSCDPTDPATDTASPCSSPTQHMDDTLSSQLNV